MSKLFQIYTITYKVPGSESFSVGTFNVSEEHQTIDSSITGSEFIEQLDSYDDYKNVRRLI